MTSKRPASRNAPMSIASAVASALLVCAANGAQADISISPQNPPAGSMVSLSACVGLKRVDADPLNVLVQLDGKPALNNSKVFGWCVPTESFFGLPGKVGFGAQAFTHDHWEVPGNSPPMTTVPTVLFNVGGPGDHTVTVTAEYRDGTRVQESYVIHTAPGADRVEHPAKQGGAGGSPGSIQWGGSPGSSLAPAQAAKSQMTASPSTIAQATTPKQFVSAVVLSPPHGPSGTQVHVSVCGFPGPQGAQYDVSVDNVKAYINLPVAACGSGKFGFGTGTSLPPINVTVSGSRGSRHTIDVTSLGSATYIVDP